MLENKRLNMILSLIIAICLWAYVIGEINPTATRTFREIPIVLINEEVLDDSGLAVLSVSDAVLNVTLTGTRSNVNQIRSKDIVATVDLAEAAKGENQLKIDIRVPDNVEIEDKTLNKVTIVVEEQVSKEVAIHVNYNGTFEDDQEPITVETSRDTVEVTGAASNVGKVSSVEAIVEEGKVTDELKTFDSRLIPVDRSGVQVENVDLLEETIQVTAELAKTKTVPLEVPIVESEDSIIERKVSVPETITLKGKGSDLEQIDSITAEEINIDDIMEDTTVPVIPILPGQVEISSKSDENLVATINVTKMESKTFTFNGSDIKFENLGETLGVTVNTKEIQVTILGTADLVNSIEKDDFVLSADLTDLGAGQHTVDLNMKCAVTKVDLEYNPQRVKITIEEE